VPEPDIADDGLPVARHVVSLPVIPIMPLGSGLTPGDASSVAPRGIPIGETVEPGTMPSGDVIPMDGVVAELICARADPALDTVAAMISTVRYFIVTSRKRPGDRCSALADRCRIDTNSGLVRYRVVAVSGIRLRGRHHVQRFTKI
jgi:hypothetical protein